jgi:hypothetical protein
MLSALRNSRLSLSIGDRNNDGKTDVTAELTIKGFALPPVTANLDDSGVAAIVDKVVDGIMSLIGYRAGR